MKRHKHIQIHKIETELRSSYPFQPHSNIMAIMDTDDLLATLRMMRKQEDETVYRVTDYLHVTKPFVVNDDTRDDDANHSNVSRQHSHAPILIDASARFKMIEWCYQIVDMCRYHRETVSIAISHLDRFLSTPMGHTALTNISTFQLTVLTCLYTAVKVHEAEALEPRTVASISRGAFTEHEIVAMEVTILQALLWRLNPPTATACLHFMMELIRPLMTSLQQDAVYDLANFQIELALEEYEYATLPPSVVATAALMNAIEQLVDHPEQLSRQIWSLMSSIAPLDCHASLLQTTKQQLCDALNFGQFAFSSLSSHEPSSSSSSSSGISGAYMEQSKSASCDQHCDQHSPRSILKTRSWPAPKTHESS